MGRRERRREEGKSKTGKIILIVLIVLIILAAGAFAAWKILSNNEENTPEQPEENVAEEVVPEKQLEIVDVNSKSRPYAVMINNNHAAWPQCGIQDAYLVYEIIVEGGITRMMALYKDQETAKIGSIRSARHYFIDYAEENDAIYIHWGGSPYAYNRISSSDIDDIDGLALEGSTFFRDKTLNRATEHTGFTSMEKLKEYAEEKGYDRDTTKDLLLNYSVDEIDTSTLEGATVASSVTLRYSDYHTTSYEYDEENKVYKRSMSGEANIDLVTGEQYTTKNILVYQVKNYTVSGDSKGRQDIDNIGTGEGYYISNGYAVPIIWEKDAHDEQTVYKYENGEEIVVNDGNTFIQICPLDAKITIE